ncbi:MAG: hypothetical protein V7695_19145, partial [Sulfitobacter sp.]
MSKSLAQECAPKRTGVQGPEFEGGVSVKQAALSGVRRAALGAAMLCLGGEFTYAADVKFNDLADEGLRDALRGGSLLHEQTLLEENKPSAGEILAAAQADYKRLLAVLYDNGYFSGSIAISVDGREASSIPPVQPPS